MEFIRRHKNLLAILGIALFFLCFFYKTLVLQQPISTAYLLADRDLLFSQFRNTSAHFDWDQSLFLLKIPNFFTVAESWRSGNLPLWNPYVGLGFPMVGDLQSCIFSPWRILGSLCPTIEFYNFGVLMQLLFGSVGCYLLSRFLKLSVFSSIFVALIFSLSPYQLTYLELLNGPTFTMYPWLFLAFVRAAEKGSLRRLVIAALATALIIFIGHSLLAFTGICTASLLFILLSIFVYHGKESRVTALRSAAVGIASIGIFSGCFASPVLFPFLEYMNKSVCYKFAMQQEILSWMTMPYFLMHPGAGAQSPWLGILALPLLATAFVLKDERRSIYRCVAGAIVLVYPVMCSIGPMEYLSSVTPLHLIPGIYYTFAVMLLLSIGAGFGLDAIADDALKSNKYLIASAVVLAVALALPQVVHLCHADLNSISFSGLLPVAHLRSKIWITDLCLSIGFIVAVIALRTGKISPHCASMTALILCLVSELLVSRNSLPVRPKFDFVVTPAHKILRDTGERVAPLGFDVLAANTNAIYGIRSLAMHNAVFHKRFAHFVTKAGLHADHFNILPEKFEQSRLIDLLSVAYVIGLAPATSTDEELDKSTSIKSTQSAQFEDGVTLKGFEAAADFQNREIIGKLDWQIDGASNVPAPQAQKDGNKAESKPAVNNAAALAAKAKSTLSDRYFSTAVVSDANGNPMWFGGSIPVMGRTRPPRFNFTAILPESLAANQEFRVGVKIFDAKKGVFIAFKADNQNAGKDVYTLGSWRMPAPGQQHAEKRKERFQLIKDLGSDHIRIYKNTTALPQAYLVGRILPANSGEEALQHISSADFPARRMAVVEIDSKTWQPADSDFCRIFQKAEQLNAVQQKLLEKLAVNGSALPEEAPPRVERISANRVRISCNTSKDALLVFTDFFYPGWKARVDGKDTPILCTNYAMRGVALLPGNHVVEFSYEPASFYLGSSLAAGLLAVLSLFLVLKRNSKPDATPIST